MFNTQYFTNAHFPSPISPHFLLLFPNAFMKDIFSFCFSHFLLFLTLFQTLLFTILLLKGYLYFNLPPFNTILLSRVIISNNYSNSDFFLALTALPAVCEKFSTMNMYSWPLSLSSLGIITKYIFIIFHY